MGHPNIQSGGIIFFFLRLISNSAIGLPCGHPLLEQGLKDVERSYHPNIYFSVGPYLLAEAARNLRNVSAVEELLESPSPLIPIVPRQTLEPFTLDEVDSVCFSETQIHFDYWKSKLENSSAIHFSNWAMKFAVKDPKYHIHALLGPRYCPIAFDATAYF